MRGKSALMLRNQPPTVDLSSIERSIKLGFIRKVYSILATQLALTVAIVVAFIYFSFENTDGTGPNPEYVTEFGNYLYNNVWIIFVSIIPIIAIICALHSMKNKCALARRPIKSRSPLIYWRNP